MHAASSSHTMLGLEQQLDLLNEGADIASRNLERLVSTQFDGYRDWLRAVGDTTHPHPVEQHFDHGLQLGCALWVAQVSAITDAMQLVERAVADQHRQMLGRLGAPAGQADQPLKQALCLSGCSYDALSKATRQVANFASNRFAAAAVSAFQQARDKISESV
ncbi:MAG: hypothetical protein JO142_14310 [Burkholderiales bacterium]|nr:hypothetical protein [Burkholderiales bacterium]